MELAVSPACLLPRDAAVSREVAAALGPWLIVPCTVHINVQLAKVCSCPVGVWKNQAMGALQLTGMECRTVHAAVG